MSFVGLVSAERADLADLLRTLTPQQWEHPSLCEGWRVRDVVAHVIQVDDVGLGSHVVAFVRAGFRPDRFNANGVARRAGWSTEQLLTTLERQVEVGRLSRIRRGIPALADTLVHHQDIRRPLALPRAIPADRLRVVLEHPDPFTGARRRAKGLRFVASDMDWSSGTGPEVSGPAEAIVMAVAGRGAALDDLAGAGKELLTERP